LILYDPLKDVRRRAPDVDKKSYNLISKLSITQSDSTTIFMYRYVKSFKQKH
jgi:hypothetical protein